MNILERILVVVFFIVLFIICKRDTERKILVGIIIWMLIVALIQKC